MTKFEGDWRSVKQFADWVDFVNDWSKLSLVYARIQADAYGNDPLGIIDKIDSKYVWTEQEGNGPDIILPELSKGDWNSGGVEAWYIGAWPRNPETSVAIQTMMEIDCGYCLNGEIADPSDCEHCDYEGVLWMRLEDTGFNVPLVSNLQELESFRVEKVKSNSLSPDAFLSLGKKYDQAGNLDIAVCFWHRAAELGNARAMFNLGHVAKERHELELCERWWLKSAELNFVDAAYSLGVFYKDAARMPEAINWLERAQALGDSEASQVLEIFRSLGLDSNFPIDADLLTADQLKKLAFLYNKWRDSEKVIFYLTKLVELGDLGAMNDLALALSDKGHSQEAITLLTKASEAGLETAMVNLGIAYIKESNYTQAKKWLVLASNLGNELAKANLEIMQSRGEDPDRVL